MAFFVDGRKKMSDAPPAMTQKRVTLRTLELCRFIAALVVMLVHILPKSQDYTTDKSVIFSFISDEHALLSVEYFFVLSGFVMITAHYDDFGYFKSVPKFFWRRACRIYPMYWISLSIACYYLFGALDLNYGSKLALLLPVTTNEMIPPAWSLRYELTFYLMFGLCLMPYFGKIILLFWIAAVTWFIAPEFWHTYFWLPYPILVLQWAKNTAPFLDHVLSGLEIYFFFGLLVGWINTKYLMNARFGLLLFIMGAVIAIQTLPAFSLGDWSQNPLLAYRAALGHSMVILGLASMERHGWIKLGRWAVVAGAISYPLYILHGAIMLVVGESTKGLHLEIGEARVFGAVYALGTLGLCMAAALLVDQPLQRLLRRIGRRSPAPFTAPPAAAPLSKITDSSEVSKAPVAEAQ